MANYKRFLSYLFAYEGDQKKENCGFARVEIREDVQRIFLSVKNKESAEVLHVFGFYRTEKGCGLVPIGRMVVKNGTGQLQYRNNGTHLAGSTISFDELCGLVAGRQEPFSNAYATVWDDKPFGLSLFAEKKEDPIKEMPDELPKKPISQTESSGEELETMEVGKKPESKPLPFEYKTNEIWEALSKRYPHIETLPGDSIVCLKAQPADIGRLPRQNWVLSSNGFLMYSFVKHRYIVFARVMEDHYELWVPGNYEKSEELMAQMFGFYRFRSVKSQKPGTGDFGYWCVPLILPADEKRQRGTYESTAV